MEDKPSKLPVVLDACDDDESAFAAEWVDAVVKDGTFRLLASRPKISASKSQRVRAGDAVKLTHSRGIWSRVTRCVVARAQDTGHHSAYRQVPYGEAHST
jgi:hypothetical protein